MKTGVYNGWIMFPSGWANFKLYEVGKYYTEIGFGAITWHGMTVNLARWNKLPKEVQDIILEVAHEYELKTGTVNKADYPEADRRAEGARQYRAHAAGESPPGMGELARRLAGAEGQGTRRQGPAGNAGAGSHAAGRRGHRLQMAGSL